MNTKIAIGVVIVLIILGGIFFMFKGGSSTPPAGGTGTTASSTAQVQGQDVSVGTGATASPGSEVQVLYAGYIGQISSSTLFDSSAAHGNQPLSFTLGSNNLIAGFQIGVNGMKVGGERMLSIPPELGYGSQDVKDPTSGKVIIPAGSTLIFDVKLVGVTPGTSTPATH